MSSQSNGVSRAMMGLEYAEHFIVWSIRRIIAARGPDGRLLDECMSVFEEDGDAGLRVLSVFLGLLGRSARRSFEVGSPETMFITWDERCILALLAAAQAAACEGRIDLLDAHLRMLSKLPGRSELAQAAVSLAELFTVRGHRIQLEPAPPKDQADPGFQLHLVAQDAGAGVSLRYAEGDALWTIEDAAARPA